jgi:hypothetical protein
VGALPGVLPENWELPLHFVPAPPDMTVMPVVEITPSPAPTSGTEAAVQNPLTITKVIDVGDSYILIGEFQPSAPSRAGNWSYGENWLSLGSIVKLSDANNQEVLYDLPQDVDLPSPSSPTAEVWAIKFSKGFAPPLHIAYSNQYSLAAPSQETVEVEFDAGPNPKEGQTWQLNKEIQLSGHTFTLVSVTASQQGYSFDFVSSDKTIRSVGVDIVGYPSKGGGGGGGGSDQSNTWSLGVNYDNYAELPKGNLKVILSNLWLDGEAKDWTLDWQPPLH